MKDRTKNGRRNHTLIVLSFVFFLTALGAVSQARLARKEHKLAVSVPGLHLSSNERIVAFDIHVVSGRVAALPDIPIGWNVSVNNDPSWNTKVAGSLKVGAAAVDPIFFRNFLVVEENQSATIPFQLSGDVVVTKDFAEERQIALSSKDFSFGPEHLLKPAGQ